MPWVNSYLSNISLLAPFLCLACLAFAGFILSIKIPKDTTGCELDSIATKDSDMLSSQ